MEEISINSFDEYRKEVSRNKVRKYIYRGQNNYDFKLESSLYRAFKRNKKLRVRNDSNKDPISRLKQEKEMLESFKRTSYIFLKTRPDNYSSRDWLALMQHYGAPTRLLDFSISPYIALYFALSGACENPASVYCVNCEKMDEAYKDRHQKKLLISLANESEKKKLFLKCYEPKFYTERLFAQQGVFLFPNTLNFSHEDILNGVDSDEFCTKIKIERSAFKDCI